MLWQQLTFDPIHVGAAALGYMSKAIHAHLVMYGEGAELIPGLAERWEVLEQGHVYRFHLRRGVRFHNGRTLEAKDVYDSLRAAAAAGAELAVELDHARTCAAPRT